MHKRQTAAALVAACALVAVAAVTRGSLRCSGTGCSLTAQIPVVLCGNGRLDDGEECDDGRFNGTTDCSLECKLFYCGDDIVSPHLGEQCEPSYTEVTVIDPVTLQEVVERHFDAPVCGVYCTVPICDSDGKCVGGCKRKFLPACEEGSSSSSEAMVTESGSFASEAVVDEGLVPPPPTCGNGTVDKAEQCDDGGRNSDTRADACRIDCTLPRCGDGVKDRGEECDDGNSVNDDGCTVTCMLTRCGDGILQRGEECDDGNNLNDDGCSNQCRVPRCGDGIVQRGEECDDGNSVTNDLCSNECRLPRCGDGVKQSGEECDDGARNSATRPDTCRTTCLQPSCGDGVKDKGEECDDGVRNSDTRANSCRLDCLRPRCGDGVIDIGEQCDDGDTMSNDGCSTICRVEEGFTCGGLPSVCIEIGASSSSSLSPLNLPQLPPANAVCGNGTVEVGEQCDSGPVNSNTAPNACRLNCVLPHCGDGVKDRGEECDGGDRCSAECVQLSHAAAYLSEASTGRVVTLAVLTILEVIVLGLFLFRRSLTHVFGHAAVGAVMRTSLDDVPLNDIEMPGLK